MGGVSLDEMFEVLRAVQRRRVPVELLESPDGTVHGSTDSETETRFGADRTTLRHVHFPKLENHGFIDWDRDEYV